MLGYQVFDSVGSLLHIVQTLSIVGGIFAIGRLIVPRFIFLRRHDAQTQRRLWTWVVICTASFTVAKASYVCWKEYRLRHDPWGPYARRPIEGSSEQSGKEPDPSRPDATPSWADEHWDARERPASH